MVISSRSKAFPLLRKSMALLKPAVTFPTGGNVHHTLRDENRFCSRSTYGNLKCSSISIVRERCTLATHATARGLNSYKQRDISTVTKSGKRNELEDVIQTDSHQMNQAARFGFSAIPITVIIDTLIHEAFEEELDEYMSLDILATLTSLHLGWTMSWLWCLKTLRISLRGASGDPLSNLAQRLNDSFRRDIAQQQSTPSSASVDPDADIRDDENGTTPTLGKQTNVTQFSDLQSHNVRKAQLMTAREQEEARENHFTRIKSSYNLGLFAPLSLFFSTAPILSEILGPIDEQFFEEERGQQIQEESVVDKFSFPSWDELFAENGAIFHDTMDYTEMIDFAQLWGLCAVGAIWTGRRAYKAYKVRVNHPPTNLPVRVSLRAAALMDKRKIDMQK